MFMRSVEQIDYMSFVHFMDNQIDDGEEGRVREEMERRIKEVKKRSRRRVLLHLIWGNKILINRHKTTIIRCVNQ